MTKDQIRANLRAMDDDTLWNTLCVNTPGDMDASIMSTEELIEYGVNHWQEKAHESLQDRLEIATTALLGIAKTQANSNSEPDAMGEALDWCINMAETACRELDILN